MVPGARRGAVQHCAGGGTASCCGAPLFLQSARREGGTNQILTLAGLAQVTHRSTVEVADRLTQDRAGLFSPKQAVTRCWACCCQQRHLVVGKGRGLCQLFHLLNDALRAWGELSRGRAARMQGYTSLLHP